MAFINEVPKAPNRTNKYVKQYCTFYCHNVTCNHWKNSYKQNPTTLKKMNKNIFDWYVQSLHNNKLGLNYGSINLLVFLIGYPLLGIFLVWNLIKK